MSRALRILKGIFHSYWLVFLVLIAPLIIFEIFSFFFIRPLTIAASEDPIGSDHSGFVGVAIFIYFFALGFSVWCGLVASLNGYLRGGIARALGQGILFLCISFWLLTTSSGKEFRLMFVHLVNPPPASIEDCTNGFPEGNRRDRCIFEIAEQHCDPQLCRYMGNYSNIQSCAHGPICINEGAKNTVHQKALEYMLSDPPLIIEDTDTNAPSLHTYIQQHFHVTPDRNAFAKLDSSIYFYPPNSSYAISLSGLIPRPDAYNPGPVIQILFSEDLEPITAKLLNS